MTSSSSSLSFDFSQWPPEFTADQLTELTRLATTYSLAHGLLYLPPRPQPPPPPSAAPASAIHAPISLVPAPFPRKLFGEVKKLQRIYNVLYARIALDEEFLDRIMGEGGGVADVDDFTRQLWRIWKELRDDGHAAESTHLGIFRSDYLLHAPSPEEPISLRQVEFNTISSSFGALSERAAALHRYLLASTDYYGSSPLLTPDNLPENGTTSTIADALAAAHTAYGVKNAYILFVVQPNERNVFDQRWIEYELLERHSIKVIRQTFSELSQSATIHPTNRKLTITTSTTTAEKEIAVIYYRAGYTPTDYPNPTYYQIRKRLESSRATNCPTIALQLAGGKKVQQELTREGVLERFLLPREGAAGKGEGGGFGSVKFTREDVESIRASWVPMWGLNEPGGVERALSLSSSPSSPTPPSSSSENPRTRGLVLKPQREGGGNNVYKEDIPAFLKGLDVEERAAWIAMAIIETPERVGGYLVRAGAGSGADSGSGSGTGEEKEYQKPVEVISELGIFGWALFSGRQVESGIEMKEKEGEGGWLVRTKGKESNEGGVAVGFSVLDSVVLVD